MSLIHSFTKLVTTILANQLVPHLLDLVSNNQTTFIKGWNTATFGQSHQSTPLHSLYADLGQWAARTDHFSPLRDQARGPVFSYSFYSSLGCPNSLVSAASQETKAVLMPKSVLLPLVDKVADKLPGWKASLLNHAGRLVVVKSILATMAALDLPKWMIRAIDTLRRGFLWKGQEPRGKLSSLLD
ncbi:hypothetical protein U9M48_024799 [Paspalum notatum var. saurae]|uniref:Reverse transcriptase n=1 Tax=Paspalum notatum var. saurae TaxID=547442 RepID=A0AAQ3TTQ1_PASNO